jgi:hypothetical protein
MSASDEVDRRPDSDDELPEHHSDRRRFLIWGFMLGAVPRERVIERALAELEEQKP